MLSRLAFGFVIGGLAIIALAVFCGIYIGLVVAMVVWFGVPPEVAQVFVSGAAVFLLFAILGFHFSGKSA